MHRPGVMAPPDLYDRPLRAGVCSPAAASPEPIELKFFLWALAAALFAVELALQLS
jgi:hypothetical protein